MKKFGVLALILLLMVLVMTIIGCNSAYSLSFKEDAYIVEPEQTFSPQIKIFPRRQDYTLISSNPTIAKVNGKEIITLKEGVITLTALSGDTVATTKLYVIKEEEYTGNLPLPSPEYVRVSFLIEDYIITSPMEIQKGMVPGAPYNLKRGGYALDGWYTDRECTQKFDFNQPVDKNVTVYGKWIILDAQYLFEKVDGNTSYIKSLAYPTVPYTQLELPIKANDGTTVIGIQNGAFKGKKTIEKVTIPDQYTYIGEQAFEECTALEQVNISTKSQLTVIDNNAFYKCGKLTDITLPPLITEIGAFAFAECASLNIQTLPQGLEVLQQFVFSKTATTSIDLENITEIKQGAFSGCSQLATVTNTHNVIRCVKEAFKNTYIYSASHAANNKVAYIDTILVGATQDTYFTISENTTLIADQALNNYPDLIVTIPSQPPLVGDNAIHNDAIVVVNESYYEEARTNLPWSTYRANLYTQFEENDFVILKRKRSTAGDIYTLRKYTGDAVHLDLNYLPFDIERIWAGAFSNNAADTEEDKLKLKTLTMGKVEKIKDYAISNIETLLAIIITDETNIPEITSSLSIQKNNALKIYVPQNLINDYKDNKKEWSTYNSYLYSADILNNGMALSVKTGNTVNYVVQYIGDDATVIIPDYYESCPITTISSYAFQFNTSVKHLIIGNNITEIAGAAITNTEIEILEFLNPQPPTIGSYFLYQNKGLQKIVVPQGSLTAYKDALPSTFSSIIEEAE